VLVSWAGCACQLGAACLPVGRGGRCRSPADCMPGSPCATADTWIGTTVDIEWPPIIPPPVIADIAEAIAAADIMGMPGGCIGGKFAGIVGGCIGGKFAGITKPHDALLSCVSGADVACGDIPGETEEGGGQRLCVRTRGGARCGALDMEIVVAPPCIAMWWPSICRFSGGCSTGCVARGRRRQLVNHRAPSPNQVRPRPAYFWRAGKQKARGRGALLGGRQRTTGNGAERLLPAEGKPRPWVCTACAAGAMAMAAPTAFSAMTATGCTLVAVARVGCGSPATHKELKKDAGSEEVGGGEGGKGGESASADQPKNWQVRTETPPVAPQNAGMAGARVREE
jgi:hypothetical protein